jgi:hypothetical protein
MDGHSQFRRSEPLVPELLVRNRRAPMNPRYEKVTKVLDLRVILLRMHLERRWKCEQISLQKPGTKGETRGLQRDVVYLCGPVAPSYRSTNAGGGGELRGLIQ